MKFSIEIKEQAKEGAIDAFLYYESRQKQLIKPFPYLIIFEIIDQSIIVYKVVFAKRHPDKLYK